MSPFSDIMNRKPDTIWKALADPTRRRVLDLLARRPRTTGQLCEHFQPPARGGLCRTATMKHLGILQRAGLIVVRREGRVRWNRINPTPIQRVCDRWVSKHIQHLTDSFQRLKSHVESENGEPLTE
ncbi:MAG: ArsR/SmtB family transcription factor [Phycisphaerae bacterium]